MATLVSGFSFLAKIGYYNVAVMNTNDIRAKYLEFFKDRGHAIVPSASLVPENDPTTLFTGSGMQPMVPYLLGEKHPLGTRIVDSQKSFRAEDLEEVGDNRHTTFFEMLGNWSLGDYFKEDQLRWFFEFLTDTVGLNPEHLYVTVFSGDEDAGIPRDTESVAIWKKLFKEKGIDAQDIELLTEEQGGEQGMQEGRIFYYDAKKNWWSRAGVPAAMPAGEPGGPDSEVFYEFTDVEHDLAYGEHCHPNCDCGRFMEIGNSVFMVYQKQEDGTFAELAQKNVDFGGGLERIVAAAQNDPDVFMIDTLGAIVRELENVSGTSYKENTHAFRVIADHMRAVVFMMSDGVIPSSSEQGYIARRLIRRAVRYADGLGIQGGEIHKLADVVADLYKDAYPDITEQKETIARSIQEEEAKFRKTLTKGLREFEKLSGDISGEQAFDLYQTYGFPIEMTEELAQEKGMTVDVEGFKKALKEHQKASKQGAAGKFKGGLADSSEQVTKLHTAHHLLLAALQEVLGEDVKQRGSNITGERLRIDFSFERKLTDEEKQKVEAIVNEKIQAGLRVVRREMPLEEARELGAEMEFGAKYPDIVSVYFIEDEEGNVFSKEFCGGPHVESVKDLGQFRIKSEKASSAGVRRIKATLE